MARRLTYKLTGVEKVLKNLNKEIRKIKGLSMKGLIQASVLIRRDMDKTPPLIPIDLGNLRASWFVVTGSGKGPTTASVFTGADSSKMGARHSSIVAQNLSKATGKLLVIMGFSANYASAVEENSGAKNWSRPGSGRAFFQSALKRNKGKILKTIANAAKIK